MKQLHHVYYLYKGKKLVYVGRSVNPVARKTVHERNHKCKLRLEVLFITSNFKQAANLERSEIRRLRPAFNQIVNSASGMLGYRHAADSCRKMSETKLLHPMPEASREILRIINTGKRMAKEIKAKISKKLQGRTLRYLMSISAR